ncbi:integrase core domain-containing protein [Streptomyces sp. NPDC005373]|uniref:integrase core domain-containing protein n=1 Tax=Streptomyces sp. NPDC005373 TaxID=3156879 RepID=UPI00339F43B9
MPRKNSITERWVQSCRHELLDRNTLTWNETHLRHVLHEYEQDYNSHRVHQAVKQAAPLRPLPQPIADPYQIARLDIGRHDRPGGVIHEYRCRPSCTDEDFRRRAARVSGPRSTPRSAEPETTPPAAPDHGIEQSVMARP